MSKEQEIIVFLKETLSQVQNQLKEEKEININLYQENIKLRCNEFETKVNINELEKNKEKLENDIKNCHRELKRVLSNSPSKIKEKKSGIEIELKKLIEEKIKLEKIVLEERLEKESLNKSIEELSRQNKKLETDLKSSKKKEAIIKRLTSSIVSPPANPNQKPTSRKNNEINVDNIIDTMRLTHNLLDSSESSESSSTN